MRFQVGRFVPGRTDKAFDDVSDVDAVFQRERIAEALAALEREGPVVTGDYGIRVEDPDKR